MRTSLAEQTLWQVKLKGNRTWIGTENELRQQHPTWITYARPYQPEPQSDSQELTTREALEAAGYDFLNDDENIGRSPTSARRYAPLPNQSQVEYEYRNTVVQTKIPSRSSAHRQPRSNLNRAQPPDVIHAPARKDTTEKDAAAPKRQRRHWPPLWYLGMGMIVTLFLWQGGLALSNWWTNTQDDWVYTKAFRTSSVDMAVGHNHDSQTHPSHFIVQNDKRHIVIIEFPADDTAKGVIYTAPTIIGDGGERTPVTLSFQRNPQTGRLDMVLHVEGERYVFTNNGTKFVPLPEQ